MAKKKRDINNSTTNQIITLFKDKAVMEKCDIIQDEKCAKSVDIRSADLTAVTKSADLSANNGAIAATSKKTAYKKGILLCIYILFR